MVAQNINMALEKAGRPKIVRYAAICGCVTSTGKRSADLSSRRHTASDEDVRKRFWLYRFFQNYCNLQFSTPSFARGYRIPSSLGMDVEKYVFIRPLSDFYFHAFLCGNFYPQGINSIV